MSTKHVTVFNGDDASPEVMVPAVDILKSMNLDIEFSYPLIGAAAKVATGAATRDGLAKAKASPSRSARRPRRDVLHAKDAT